MKIVNFSIKECTLDRSSSFSYRGIRSILPELSYHPTLKFFDEYQALKERLNKGLKTLDLEMPRRQTLAA